MESDLRLDNKSRMSREAHVRFREGLGVRFPRATRLVMGFQYRDDAERFRQDLAERMQKFGLTLHPDKTRLIEFGRYAASNRQRGGRGKPETFDFLGFTHCCGQTRRGAFKLLRISIAKRMRATLQSIKEKLRKRMHQPLHVTGAWLSRVMQGWLRYHAVPGNYQRLNQFRNAVARLWLRAIRRRSEKARSRWNWKRFQPHLQRWFPRTRILHPYPEDRFRSRHQPKAGAV